LPCAYLSNVVKAQTNVFSGHTKEQPEPVQHDWVPCEFHTEPNTTVQTALKALAGLEVLLK